METSSELTVFTKYPSCLTGPSGEILLPSDQVDWEVELVGVMGKTAKNVAASAAWDFVAGLTAGQDISARDIQFAGALPQFSLAKSYKGFGPIGPAVLTVDEFEDPDNIAIRSVLNGDEVQFSRTSDMLVGVPEIVARLSRVVTLYPGDLIFTGTPEGVGWGMNPKRYLTTDDVLITDVEVIGLMRHTFVSR